MVNHGKSSLCSLLLIIFLMLMYSQVIDKAEYSRLDRIITNALLLGIVGLNLYSLGINLRALHSRKGKFFQQVIFFSLVLLILCTHSIYLFGDSMEIYGFYHRYISILKEI